MLLRHPSLTGTHRYDTLTMPAASHVGVRDAKGLIVSQRGQAIRASLCILVSIQVLLGCSTPIPPVRVQDGKSVPPLAATSVPAAAAPVPQRTDEVARPPWAGAAPVIATPPVLAAT